MFFLMPSDMDPVQDAAAAPDFEAVFKDSVDNDAFVSPDI